MQNKIQDLITAYQYWSNRYASSSHVTDLQQKHTLFQQLKEEADKQNISEDDFEKRLAH